MSRRAAVPLISAPKHAARVDALARKVGGRMGDMLRQVVAMAAQGGVPDFGVRTRTAVSSQAAAYLASLGGYSGDDVSIATMKKMRRDPQIRLALAATRAPILEAPLYFESTSREAVALADVHWMDSGVLRALQGTSMQALEFGFAAHELLWEQVPELELTWSLPGKMVAATDMQRTIRRNGVAPRVAKDLDPALVTLLQDEAASFQGILYGNANVFASLRDGKVTVQQLIAANPYNYVPPEKAFLFTYEGDWSNPWGFGRYVSAYDPWFWQKIIYLICNRWYERKSDPPYLGWAPSDPGLSAPEDATEDDYDPTSEMRSPILKLRYLLENTLRSSGCLVLPSEPFKDADDKPSSMRAYDLKELGLEDVHPAFIAYINHLDVKKTRAMLVPDGAIATSEHSGTYGSTQSLSALAVKVQNETLSGWVRHVNRHVLPRWARYNGIRERIVLRTTGISQDNRDLLAAMAERTYEADMLLEQRWGPQFQDSLTRLVDRRKILRGIGVPFVEPEPGAPPPALPTPPPEPAGLGDKPPKSKTGLSAAKGAAKKAAPGGPVPARKMLLDATTPAFEAWAAEAADAFEGTVAAAAEASPYPRTIEDHRKAVAAIVLWLLLRADKVDAAGRPKKGQGKRLDRYIYDAAGKVWPAERLASHLAELEALAADIESVGLRVDAVKAKQLLRQAERAVTTTLSRLPDAVAAALEPEVYLAPALEAARSTFRNLVERFDSDAETEDLASAEVASIVGLNSRGLIWNIENIAVRNTRSIVEKILNDLGTKRRLGVVSETLAERFNQLYTDLSVEAHYRGVFRGAMAALAEKNDYRWMLMVSASPASYSTGSEYAGTVRTIEEWERLGERSGAPHALRQFGFHPGSRSFWFPVPQGQRKRGGDGAFVDNLALALIQRGRRPRGAAKA